MQCCAAGQRFRLTRRRPAQAAHLQSTSGGASSCNAAAGLAALRNNLVVNVRYSKRLPQCNEDLRGADTGDRLQVMTDIDSDRTDGCGVTQPETDRAGVVGTEVPEAHRIEDIASV